MNKKTAELINKHAEEIAEIRALNARIAELKSQITPNATVEQHLEEQGLFDEIDRLTWERNAKFEALRQQIEWAYFNVPFAKPRNQGIDNFWKEAGLA